MDNNRITLGEVSNDGQSIYLYFNSMIGAYTAYGLSAFYTTRIVNPLVSYSDEMQMPVIVLSNELIKDLKEKVELIDHQQRLYYSFKMYVFVGEKGYAEWAGNLRQSHLSI